MVLAAVFVASVIRTFRSLQDRPGQTVDEPPVLSPSGKAFSLSCTSDWHSQLFYAVSAARCAEASALAGSTGYSFLARDPGGYRFGFLGVVLHRRGSLSDRFGIPLVSEFFLPHGADHSAGNHSPLGWLDTINKT